MKKILCLILCLGMIAALTGCKDEPAESSATVSIAPFDPNNYDPTDYTQVFDPNSSDFSLPTEGDPFTKEEILELAKKQFQSVWGFEPKAEIVYEVGDVIYIYFYDYAYVMDDDGVVQVEPVEGEIDYNNVSGFDLYIINIKSATGQNSAGEDIDLTAYI